MPTAVYPPWANYNKLLLRESAATEDFEEASINPLFHRHLENCLGPGTRLVDISDGDSDTDKRQEVQDGDPKIGKPLKALTHGS